MRQVVLDTETTGLSIEAGHRIIEVGCVEIIHRRLTNNHFHFYLNPDREVDPGAFAVHGLSNEFLQDKPRFPDIADALFGFLDGAELIIHNAPFDLAFLNYELTLLNQKWQRIENHCTVLDTLTLARQMHVGQRNSLDALCKRYSVDGSQREFHGALLDANLLARVYLAMTMGQGSFFDMINFDSSYQDQTDPQALSGLSDVSMVVLNANADELAEHDRYLTFMQKNGACLWLDD